MKKNSYEKSENSYDRKIEKDFENILKRDPVKLTDEELKKKIGQFLDKNRICTLSTCYNNMPRSTPVRYRSNGLTIYIVTEGGGKIRNIMKNPLVSVSLFGDYSGFQSVKGLQIWGKAEIIAPNKKDSHAEALKVLQLKERDDLKEIDMKDVRQDMYIIKINTQKARYLDFPEGILNQTLILEK
jgi:nitroimidazol reductase NimA-like FMN-containing flavoprotein (pyridoxamine 5'-phosphate oxidase superfamily)